MTDVLTPDVEAQLSQIYGNGSAAPALTPDVEAQLSQIYGNGQPKPLQPTNFMQRVGMAAAGDPAQQAEVARQAGVYGQAGETGLLSIPDVPGSIAAIAPALGTFIGSQAKPGPQPSFVADLQDEINKSPITPQLGKKFDDYLASIGMSNVPKDNTEKNIAATVQGATTGGPFGVSGVMGGGMGGFMNQEATNRGYSPDVAALLGVTGAVAGGNLPSFAENAASSVGNTVGTMAKGVKGFNPDAIQGLYDQAEQLQSAYKPSMQAAANVPLTPDAQNNFGNMISAADTSNSVTKYPKLYPGTSDIVQEINDRLAPQVDANGNPVANPLTFGDLEYFKQRLQDVAKTGQGNADSGAANAVKSQLVGYRNGLTPADIATGDPDALQNVLDANASYRAGSQMEQLADLLKNSGGDVLKFQQKLKNQLNNTNSNPFGGWQPEQVQALSDFANGNLGENVAGLVSKLGFNLSDLKSTGNVVRGLLQGGGGSVVAPSVGVPSLALGTATRLGLGALKRGQLQDIFSDLQDSATAPSVPPYNPPPAAPSPTLALPAPTPPQPDFIAGQAGVGAATPEQQAAMEAERARQASLGLTPDVRQNLANQNPDAVGARMMSPAYQAPDQLALPAPQTDIRVNPQGVAAAASPEAQALANSQRVSDSLVGLTPDVRNAIMKRILSMSPSEARQFLQKATP